MPLVPELPKERPARPERLAVNVADLDAAKGEYLLHLFAGRLDLSKPIVTDPDADNPVGSVAVAFKCPLDEAAMVVDMARSENRRTKAKEMRFYLSRGTGRPWTAAPRSKALAKVAGDDVVLNPEVFPPPALSIDEAVPLEARRPSWL